MRAIILVGAAVCLLLGCDTVDTLPTSRDAGADVVIEADAAPDDCSKHLVEHVCWGAYEDPIHGECSELGTCNITDWTCIHGKPGDACEGGFCVAPVDEQTAGTCCRKGCVDTVGLCVIDTGWHHGAPCK